MTSLPIHPRRSQRAVLGTAGRPALALALIVLAGVPLRAQGPMAALDGGATSSSASQVIVARVNGDSITQAEREQMTNRLVFQQLNSLGPNVANIPEDQIALLRSKAKKAAMTGLIDMKLLQQFKDQSKIKVTDEELGQRKQQLREMLKKNNVTYEEALSRSGRTDKEVGQMLNDQILTEKMLEARTGELEPTGEQEKAYYEQNKEKMAEPEAIRSSHILVKFPGNPRDPSNKPPTEAEKSQLRGKTDELLAKVKAGEDFAELAKKFSDDKGSAAEGGDLNFHARGAMVGPFDQAEWSMKVGEISSVVETPFGFHIIKVTDKKAGGVPKFEDVQERIHQTMTEERFRESMDNLLEDLHKKAKIEILEKEEPTPASAPPQLRLPGMTDPPTQVRPTE